MQFLNPYLLLALLGVSVPIIIHLFNRRNAREIPWGAMRFLMDSLMNRRRSLLLEEILLLASRCLLVGCAVFALARPFAPAGSAYPWWLVMPIGLCAFVLFGMGFALERYKVWRTLAWLACAVCVALCAGASFFGDRLGPRFTGGGAKDLAIVLDGSTSMTLTSDGENNFERAKRESAKLVEESSRGTAFSLIVAGSVPNPVIPAPVSDRKYVLAALAAASPVQGVMRVPDTLAAAAASLAQGNHAARQIALFGDNQAMGWQTDDLESWRFLKEAFAKLPAPPKVSVRTFSLPQGIRNVAMKSIAFSRPVVGTDREVRMDVTLVNTGHESVTPSKVTLRVEGEEKVDRTVTQMEPGSERTVAFLHRFKNPGAQLVEAQVDAHDEMPLDDTMRRVVQVIGELRVLVVDDGRATQALERPGGYLALALMPSFAGLTAAAKGDESEQSRFLIHPDWIAAPALGLRNGFADTAAIVLADVPSLPPAQAESLAAFVRQGGSLLVTHGVRSDAAFYNQWVSATTDENGTLHRTAVLPLPLGECKLTEDGLRMDTASFTHPALALFREQGDLGDAVLACYREANPDAHPERVVAKLQNGAPLMAEQAFGKGRVIQFFVPLDATAGTLVSRQSFLPLVHELVAYLARPRVATLNIAPSLGATIHLASSAAAGFVNGLLGEYSKRESPNTVRVRRVDPTLSMFWQDKPAPKMPPDNFIVRWTGSFVPRATGTYTFFVSGDDRVDISIGKGKAHSNNYGDKQQFSLECKAGERYPVAATLEEDGGEAAIRLEMEGPGFARAIVPSDCFVPQKGREDSWADSVATDVDAPNGTLAAKLRCTADGVSLRTDSPLMQGLYSVHVPENASSWLGDLAGSTNVFPLCVTENPDESRLDPLTPEEQALLMRQTDIAFAQNDEDMAKSLEGKTFGRELWRIPALLLFALLILECFITRWVDAQRG
jgi:hypothetical protein